MEEKYSGKGKNDLYFSLPTRTNLNSVQNLFWVGEGKHQFAVNVSVSIKIFKFERAAFSLLFLVFERLALSLH